MTLFHRDHTPFASGVIPYSHRPATDYDPTNRIVIQVSIESILTLAVVDTGAPYVVCAPEIAAQLRLSEKSSVQPASLQIRGTKVHGYLHRVTLSLFADEGDSIDIDATAFVPQADEWPANLPSFMGLDGCMDRMRIAIDPARDLFYFGPLA